MFEQAIRPDTLARLNELVRDGMPVHHVKALTYFLDADIEEEPLELLQPIEWEQVKSFFREQVKGLSLPEK